MTNDAMTRSAGLYLHIPFCKQACHYCNFHFSTSLRQKDAMVEAILRELELRHEYLGEAEISTVYFGGGTPSLLEISDLVQIFEKINALYRLTPHSSSLTPDSEITLEANPDDLTPAKLRDLRQYTPVNRLSIGIQSFHDHDLHWMNRAHSAHHARQCLDDALAAGFHDLTIDLIYGSPTTTDEQWAENLRIALDYGIPHLSAYCLTVEPGTALGHHVAKGKQAAPDEERAARQFEHLMDTAQATGYEHYEISNFAQPGRYARHNSNYWHGVPYLGIGPSAHSFNGHSRQWNIANNALYIKSLSENSVPCEVEELSPAMRYNEYVMTAMRTMWGVDLGKIRDMGEAFEQHFAAAVLPFVAEQTVERAGDTYRTTRSGKLLADRIAMGLFC